MSLKGKIEYVGLSHTGKVRDHNEDASGADMTLGLMVLADGMGGYNAGEVAAAMAIKTVVSHVSQGLRVMSAPEASSL